MVSVYLAERSRGPEKINDMIGVQELIVRTKVKKEMAGH